MALRSLKAALSGAAVLASVAVPASPASAVSAGSRSGVPVYNKDVCGTQWVRKARIERPWGYPNISSGWESNIYTCSGVRGACTSYPVRENHDGYPLTSVAAWLNPGVYNAAYDIWFNRTDAHPAQDNGTEIMIWIAHPGIRVGDISRHVIIDGIHWGVMTWTAHNHRTGTSWHYVAYVADHQRSAVFGIWLNPFFRNAIASHELSPYWWLTGIDFGFELVSGGVGDNVHFYKLTGLS